MDLLFREYASPFSLLNAVISSGRFVDWIDQFVESHKEKIQWEHWLHKIYEISWSDYLEECKNQEQMKTASWNKSEIETTIQNSYSMINNFIPDERGN